MLDQLKSEKWENAFGIGGARPNAVDPKASEAPFTREDVAEIFAIADGRVNGEPFSEDWFVICRLRSGVWAGLGYREEYFEDADVGRRIAEAKVASSKEELIFALDPAILGRRSFQKFNFLPKTPPPRIAKQKPGIAHAWANLAAYVDSKRVKQGSL